MTPSLPSRFQVDNEDYVNMPGLPSPASAQPIVSAGRSLLPRCQVSGGPFAHADGVNTSPRLVSPVSPIWSSSALSSWPGWRITSGQSAKVPLDRPGG